MIRLSRVFTAAALLIGGWLMASCTPHEVPQAAMHALNARWRSLPGSQTHDLVVLRAWEGKLPSQGHSFPPSMEVWCIETHAAPKSDLSQGSERMLWVVTKMNEAAEWDAAPLMIFSSTWPYEACLGKTP